jgi:hypothetical protein
MFCLMQLSYLIVGGALNTYGDCAQGRGRRKIEGKVTAEK